MLRRRSAKSCARTCCRVSYRRRGRQSGQLFCSAAPLLCFHLALHSPCARLIILGGFMPERDERSSGPSAFNNPGKHGSSAAVRPTPRAPLSFIDDSLPESLTDVVGRPRVHCGGSGVITRLQPKDELGPFVG